MLARTSIFGRLIACIRDSLAWTLIFGVRFYQSYIRPHLIGGCKFHPSCSAYAIGAIQSRGPIIGAWLAVKRVVRCHPMAVGGYDPVPSDKAGLSNTSRTLNLP